MIMIS